MLKARNSSGWTSSVLRMPWTGEQRMIEAGSSPGNMSAVATSVRRLDMA